MTTTKVSYIFNVLNVYLQNFPSDMARLKFSSLAFKENLIKGHILPTLMNIVRAIFCMTAGF